jgi:hypothetical protein
MVTPVINGPHGTFGWNCAVACAEDPDSDCGAVYVAAVDGDDHARAYGNCVYAILTSPVPPDDQDIILHGTHQLTDEQLHEIYGDDLGMPEVEPDSYQELAMGDNDTTEFLCVAVGSLNPSIGFIVTAAALTAILKGLDDQQAWAGAEATFYGTHTLPDDVLDQYFPNA